MRADIGVIVSETFREVLGLAEVPPDVSFIDLGGVSIEAEEIAGRLSSALRIDVTGVDILASETLRETVALLSARLSPGSQTTR